MIDQTLTTPPTAPSSNDIPTFRTRFDAFIAWIVTFVTQLTTVISQMNSTASTINDKEASAVNASIISVAAANFKGTYTNQTTQIGESYLWNSVIYLVLVAGNTSPTTSPSNWKAIGQISDQIHASTSKTPPVDADEFGIWDSVSSSLKKLTWANLKATIIASFGVMVNTLTSKTTLADGDIIPIGDSASSFASKYLTWANLKSNLVAYLTTTTGFSISLSTNGYIKFPSWLGSLIIQWGISGNISVDTSSTVTLPIAFPSALVALTCNPSSWTSASSYSTGSWSASKVSLSQISINNRTNINSGTFYWIAIGY